MAAADNRVVPVGDRSPDGHFARGPLSVWDAVPPEATRLDRTGAAGPVDLDPPVEPTELRAVAGDLNEDAWQGLIDRLNDRDPDAIEEVLRTYEPYLRMAIRRRLSGPLRSKLDSMDIVQSVWADLVTSFRGTGYQFRDRQHLRAFLLRVAQNRLIDRRRRHHRALQHERPMTDDSPSPAVSGEPQPGAVVEGRELWEQLNALCPAPPRDPQPASPGDHADRDRHRASACTRERPPDPR